MKIQGLIQLLMHRYLVAVQIFLGAEDSCIRLVPTAHGENHTLQIGS